MGARKLWETIPADHEMLDKSVWYDLGGKQYAMLRTRLLYVHTRGKTPIPGSDAGELTVGANDSHMVTLKRAHIVSRTDTIDTAIRLAAKTEICDDLSATLNAEVTAKAPGYSGKVGTSLVGKHKESLSEEVSQSLTSTESHVVQVIEEDTETITINGNGQERKVQLRRLYWPHTWDVYLYSFDFIQLSYHRDWLWRDIRNTIKTQQSEVLGWPLCRVVYYEPQERTTIVYEQPSEELDEPTAIQVHSLEDAMPASRGSKLEDLEEVAKLAFPVTSDERKKAARRRAKKKSAKKKVAKKAAKKKAAKKKTTRRVSAKKKAARKKTAKKRTKKASKKKAAKKKTRRRTAKR